MKYNEIALLVSLVSNINTVFSFVGLFKLQIYFMLFDLFTLLLPIPLTYTETTDKKVRVYCVLDNLALSCLYSQQINQNEHKDLRNGYLIYKYYFLLFFFVIYFAISQCINDFTDLNKVDNFQVFFFISQSINLSCHYSFMNFGEKQSDVKVFFMQASFYLSSVLFSQGKDFNGVQFQIYNVALIFITCIYITLKYNQRNNLSKMILGCLFLNYKAEKYIEIQYVCSMIRIMILLFNIQSPYGQFGLQDFSVYQSLLYFTLIFSVLQIIITFSYVFLYKKIKFFKNQQNCFLNVNQQLQSIQFWHKKVKISFKYTSIEQGQEQEQVQVLLLQDDTNQVLRFVDTVSKIQISKKHLIIKGYCFDPFIRYKYQILVNLSSIFEQLLQDLLKMNNAELYEIFQKRCQVFQISNIVSQKIFEIVKNQIRPQEVLYLNQIHSLELQLTVFDKLIRPKLYFQPTLIFYDLFEDF